MGRMANAVLLAQAADLDWRSDWSSSNVAAAAWASDFDRLFIRFHNGKTYAYDGVTLQAWASFVNAPSKGTWVDRILKKGGYAVRGPL